GDDGGQHGSRGAGHSKQCRNRSAPPASDGDHQAAVKRVNLLGQQSWRNVGHGCFFQSPGSAGGLTEADFIVARATGNNSAPPAKNQSRVATASPGYRLRG